MITLEDAYSKVFEHVYPGQYSPECIEDDTHYIFKPIPMERSSEEEFLTGVIFPAVNKKTGEVVEFNVTTDTLENPIMHKIEVSVQDSELQHHGVLGQKWGIRRYQNKDGTLTPRGKKRAARLEAEYQAITGKKEMPPPHKKASDMTDDELRIAINRKKLESDYNQFFKPKEKQKYFDGKKFVVNILETSGKNILTQLTTDKMGDAVNLIFGENTVNPKKGQKDK